MTLASNMSLGVQTLTLGLTVTFVGLAALQLIVRAMAFLSSGGKVQPQPVAVAEAAVPTPEVTQIISTAVTSSSTLDEEAAVAIAAATAAAMTRNDEEIAAIGAVMAIITAEGAQGAQIGAIRRVSGPGYAGTPNLWALAGRQDIMAGRNRRQRQ
ncbi:MAG: hypothetical protein BWY85_01561 [Firmicutes bacterium ADurb.Bin506]|jgi:hypothetical protein|nr:MAG: hypothetical protein BWY85_01561 [Firmicutes bacterium ADurb.Bin506]